MSAATSGSVVNFYEERAKVTHGRFNTARADWLLYSTSRDSNRSLFLPPGCDSEAGFWTSAAGFEKPERVCRRRPPAGVDWANLNHLNRSWGLQACSRHSSFPSRMDQEPSLGFTWLACCSGYKCADSTQTGGASQTRRNSRLLLISGFAANKRPLL